jgi:hypothetical protein
MGTRPSSFGEKGEDSPSNPAQAQGPTNRITFSNMKEITNMGKYQFAVHQEPDGLWGYHDKDGSPELLQDGDYPTQEQAKRAAEQFAYRMREGDVTEGQVMERMEALIKQWADQRGSETGLERQEVLLDIRYGVEATLDKMCPAG